MQWKLWIDACFEGHKNWNYRVTVTIFPAILVA